MAAIIQTVDGVVVNRFDVDVSGLKIGRTEGNQVRIDDSAVSSSHAEILVAKDSEGRDVFVIHDRGSTNGTFVNDKKVESQALHHQDVIRVGWNHFTFVDEGRQDIEKTAEIKKSWVPGVYYTKD